MSEELNPNPFNEANSNLTGEVGCLSCGASLKYKPGTDNLHCNHCGADNPIPVAARVIEELDFDTYISKFQASAPTTSVKTVQCKNCAATTSFPPNVTSFSCAYCTTPLILEQSIMENIITPHAVLPFKINQQEAAGKFKGWIKSLWFAPNNLQKLSASAEAMKGIYTPYWTYDSNTESYYVGQRGIWHYRTVSYSTVENGKSVTRTRQERYTVWTMAMGTVNNVFDDILVNASNSLPRNHADQLEPWPLADIKSFAPEFLSGFISEKYQVDLKNGFAFAKTKMEAEIDNTVRRDIGGNEQRIISLSTQYNDITFKHILLPIYISAYIYNNKLYRFLVNGATGKVKGERPWSAWKITFAVLGVLALIALILISASAMQK